MQHIGIAAVTAEGAALCYRTICLHAAALLGPNKHPEISLHTHSFDRIFSAQVKEDWQTVADLMVASLEKLARSGADFAVIPANSTHFVFDEIRRRSPIPLISIVDVAVEECKRLGCKRVLTLGIGITMSRGLFLKALAAGGMQSVVPDAAEQEYINRLIFDEIIPARVGPQSVSRLTEIVRRSKKEGCDAVLLGCTELPLVLDHNNCGMPAIDTTRLLALRATERAIGAEPPADRI